MNIRSLLASSAAAFGLAVIGGLLTVSGATAADFTRYPGAECVRWSGPQPSLLYSAAGNPGTVQLRMDCPVANNLGTGLNSVTVDVIDQNPSSDISCNPTTVYRSGSSWITDFKAYQFSSGASANKQTLTLVTSASPLYGSTLRHYYINCNLPPISGANQSYVVGYAVNEP